MKISHIKLVNFRNYQNLSFEPHPHFTALVGANAQGKTNLLEAIALCATGRSHRAAKDSHMIRFDCPGSYIRTDYERSNMQRSIEIRLRKNQGKQINLDSKPISKMGEMMGCLNVVFFSPEDLRLVKDGPSERRRFMDVELSQMQPIYFYALSNYHHALSQRNALLKSISINPAIQQEALISWDELLAQFGSKLIISRRSFIKTLSVIVKQKHSEISSNSESLSIQYDASIDAETEESARLAILSALQQNRDYDIRKGSTQQGPHRDDIAIKLDGMDLRAFASQGQQRSAVLALKISEISMMKDHSGESPVLLLDDVLSELDPERQRMLLEASKGAQTFMTCTQLPPDIHCDAYRVHAGNFTAI